MDPALAALMAGQGQPPAATPPAQQPLAPDFMQLVPVGGGGQQLEPTTGGSLRPSKTITIPSAANGKNEVRLPYLEITATCSVRFTDGRPPPGVEVDGNVVHCPGLSICRQPDGSVRIDADEGVCIDPCEDLDGCNLVVNGQRFTAGRERSRRGRMGFVLMPGPPIMMPMMGRRRGWRMGPGMPFSFW